LKRKGRKSAAQTPAPPKEQIYGSKKNPKGSAASKSAASKIELSTKALEALKNKRAKFKEKYPSKDVSLNTLKAVMRRGMGAYSTSFRPTITGGKPNSRQAWGFARVNKFLEKKAGKPVKKAYVQDDDLLEKGGELKLLAPNGKPSNLTPEQYRLVRTPEFKAWFGDWENDPENASKVVDENGEPKVMYHGTLFDFNEFIPEDDTGFLIDRNIYFFTDDVNVAKGFASIKKRGENKDKKVRIINAYINSRKPFDPEANKKEFDILYKITKYKNLADWMPNNWELLEEKKNVKKIKQLGYDSIITTETDSSVVFGKLSSSYKGKSLKNLGVFKSSQVKLADGTNTTFDPNNPDIRYENGGFLQSIYEGMDNLIKNGIVLTDKSKNIIVIAYNTGNQERDKSLYNKALIYYSVKPLRQANEIIENFDNEEYSLFDVKKIEEYKNAPHLIILNQNEVVYDSNNPDIRYKRGGKMKDSIALPDSYATYDKLKPILENQGYMLEKIIKPTKSIEQIAKDFSLPTSLLHKQLEIGKQHELEHTYSIELAEKTALHHLAENPFYYTHLKEMEMKVEAEKLEGYYRMGGALEGEFTCEVLDEEGERMIDPQSIESLTECISNLPQTKSMHFDYEKNDYKPYRKRLHKDIIYEFKKDLMCIENAEPIAILMGGSPASGKSTFLKKFAPYLLKEDIFKIDADEIRSKLPEYRGYNASQTHLETKDIVTTLLSDRNIGLPCKFDVIYDGTMNNNKSYVPLIDLLKSLGYKVFIVYIDKVPKDVVIKRSLERYKKQGRFVPLEVIEDFFSKGKEALNELKKQVDGYMVIDGSDTEYRVMERGGKRIPRDRNYNKLGEPIKITSEEVIREFKKGGEIDPNDPAIKEAMTHKAGAAGGLLVGNRHSEGGIKAVNKSNGQPLEMEGGEVVITRNAVSDETKREFEGEMLTNREILSRINQSGGGVSFAEGGDIPKKCACSGKTYNYGGKVRSDYDIVKEINTPSLEETAMEMYAKGGMLSIPSPFGQGTLKIPTLDSFIKRGKPLESNGIAYIPKYNKVLGEVVYYRDGDKRSKKMSSFDAYRFYLMQQFNVQFEKLNNAIKTTLIK